jgi:hypothetical protein
MTFSYSRVISYNDPAIDAGSVVSKRREARPSNRQRRLDTVAVPVRSLADNQRFATRVSRSIQHLTRHDLSHSVVCAVTDSTPWSLSPHDGP